MFRQSSEAVMPRVFLFIGCYLLASAVRADDAPRIYQHRLTPLTDAAPLLADQPDFVAPVQPGARFEAPPLLDEDGADLAVRGWRFVYNARGVIEVPNRVQARRTAVIVVHPWGIDDGQGWQSPQPAGVAFAGTPEKNRLTLDHMRRVVNPLLQSLRGKVGLVAYSLPGRADPIRKKLYRSVHGQPSAAERAEGARALAERLGAFNYRAGAVPERLSLRSDKAVVDYFHQVPGLDAGAKYNGDGFWDLPIPVARPIAVDPADVVFYDAEGYATLKRFLVEQGIRHVLLAGYHTDMCVCKTTAGYKNLAADFNTFLVGDATLATFPAAQGPQTATTTAVSFAALDVFITQVSWVRYQQAQREP
jgi:hypothetical protein